jgi:phage terminase large subunit-like protein
MRSKAKSATKNASGNSTLSQDDSATSLVKGTSFGSQLEHWKSRNRLETLYPDKGPLRRELYRKHLQFFAAGTQHQERCFMAANRVGKTFGVGGYETTLHLTGRYPDWWVGRRFADPIDAWVAGDTAQTTRDIIQAALMGPPAQLGTGLIPADTILGEPSRRAGMTGAFDTARIRHVSGGVSLLGFKSFDQGRRTFQGTAKHLVWLDEEPPVDVYDECMVRLMTTDGLMLVTFTPLKGMTEIVRRFMPELAAQA